MARENMSAKAGAGKVVPVPFSFDGDLVRVISRGDGDWFVATDAARILGYRDAANALRLLDPDEKGTHQVSTLGGPQDLLICSEPGLYKLIARSRRPKAREFDRFVRHEILPTIRRTGRYEADPAITRLNTQAMNAASRVMGELRRCHITVAERRELIFQFFVHRHLGLLPGLPHLPLPLPLIL